MNAKWPNGSNIEHGERVGRIKCSRENGNVFVSSTDHAGAVSVQTLSAVMV